MFERGLNFGDTAGAAGAAVGHGGVSFLGGLFAWVVVGLVIAATVIAIVLLINAARNRGVEVRGGRLAAFWFVGICLTPIMLALYVLTLKPATAPAHAAVSPVQPLQPVPPVPPVPPVSQGDRDFAVEPTEPLVGFEPVTEPMETVETVRVEETADRRDE